MPISLSAVMMTMRVRVMTRATRMMGCRVRSRVARAKDADSVRRFTRFSNAKSANSQERIPTVAMIASFIISTRA